MGLRFVCAFLLAAALPCAAAVSVTFTDADKYSDPGSYGDERDRNLKTIEGYFRELAGRLLPADSSLTVTVLDVDLAGERPPGTGWSSPRVMRGRADWPRIKVRYVLEQKGRKVSGEEEISDPDYLQGRSRTRGGEALPYEKLMLEEWFKARLVEGRPASR